MPNFEKLSDNIFRLKVPFGDIYTAVFLIRTDKGDILFDCATTKSDAKDFIIPALAEMESQPKYIVCSHFHSDHMGGLPFILENFKESRAAFCHRKTSVEHPEYNAMLLSDGDILLECIKVMALPGHSDDSIGLLDMRSSTLLSADCVQLGGVDRYGTGITDCEKYFSSLEKLSKSEIDSIVASHEYYPLGSVANGKKQFLYYVAESMNIAREIGRFADEINSDDPAEIAALYNSKFSDRPPISSGTVSAMLKEKSAK